MKSKPARRHSNRGQTPQRRRSGYLRRRKDRREPRIFGVAAGYGGANPGSRAGPDALREQILSPAQSPGAALPRWDDLEVPRGNIDALGAVHQIALELMEKVRTAVRHGHRFAVVGGDHSCAIGSWSGAASALGPDRPLGLIWVDAHMDAHTPRTSPSGHLHGMPLACLLGQGEPRLTGLGWTGAKLDPRHLTLVGVRSFKPEEAALLDPLGVRVIDMQEIARRGLSAAIDEAVERAAHGTAGYGVSIDLDAVDPEDAPGVGSRVPGGIGGDALAESIEALASDPRLLGIEVAELNPERDPDGRTTRLARRLLEAALDPPAGFQGGLT